MRYGLLVLATLTAGSVAVAGWAEPRKSRERGTVEAVNGDTIDLLTRAGRHVMVHITDKTRLVGVSRAEIADIKPDSYIGAAALPNSDGTLRAQEVTVFPPSMRGASEGHFPWDLSEGSTMTNGAVGSLVGTGSRTMTVKYKDGERTISVAPDVPVVALAPGQRDLLQKGTHVVALVTRDGDADAVADALLIGKDGTVPPM